MAANQTSGAPLTGATAQAYQNIPATRNFLNAMAASKQGGYTPYQGQTMQLAGGGSNPYGYGQSLMTNAPGVNYQGAAYQGAPQSGSSVYQPGQNATADAWVKSFDANGGGIKPGDPLSWVGGQIVGALPQGQVNQIMGQPGFQGQLQQLQGQANQVGRGQINPGGPMLNAQGQPNYNTPNPQLANGGTVLPNTQANTISGMEQQSQNNANDMLQQLQDYMNQLQMANTFMPTPAGIQGSLYSGPGNSPLMNMTGGTNFNQPGGANNMFPIYGGQ